MNKMVKDFEGRGISFPVLNNPNNPKQTNYGVMMENTTSPIGQSKAATNLLEVEREEKVSKKCKKFSTYNNLEKSLGSEHFPPLTKDEREKIRQARKEHKRLRALKEKKKEFAKQKSMATLSAPSVEIDDDDAEED
jgi:hypothetical protein